MAPSPSSYQYPNGHVLHTITEYPKVRYSFFEYPEFAFIAAPVATSGAHFVWAGPKDHRIVGEILADARKAAGVTQEQLADRLQKSQSLVSAYERGERRVDLLEFFILMDAIKTSPETVFSKIKVHAEGVVRRARRQTGQRP